MQGNQMLQRLRPIRGETSDPYDSMGYQAHSEFVFPGTP
jgi:hypothetical protein